MLNSSPHLAGEDRGTGNGVSLSLVCIVCDAGVGPFVRTRERNQATGSRRAGASHFQLMTAGIELSSRIGITGVQSDNLVTDEVVAGLQARRDFVRVSGITRGHERCVAPGGACTDAANLIDLEPDSSSAGHVGRAAR